MNRVMLSPDEAAARIKTGRFLALAADEAILRRLPAGNWIGGTIPYFIGEQGGMQSHELVYVTDLAEATCDASIMDYTSESMPTIARDAPENGYTVLIIPALSALHSEYAANAH